MIACTGVRFEHGLAGEWCENKIHGQGFYTYANGDMYTGTFEHGLKNGHGSYYFKVSPVHCLCPACSCNNTRFRLKS